MTGLNYPIWPTLGSLLRVRRIWTGTGGRVSGVRLPWIMRHCMFTWPRHVVNLGSGRLDLSCVLIVLSTWTPFVSDRGMVLCMFYGHFLHVRSGLLRA